METHTYTLKELIDRNIFDEKDFPRYNSYLSNRKGSYTSKGSRISIHPHERYIHEDSTFLHSSGNLIPHDITLGSFITFPTITTRYIRDPTNGNYRKVINGVEEPHEYRYDPNTKGFYKIYNPSDEPIITHPNYFKDQTLQIQRDLPTQTNQQLENISAKTELGDIEMTRIRI